MGGPGDTEPCGDGRKAAPTLGQETPGAGGGPVGSLMIWFSGVEYPDRAFVGAMDEFGFERAWVSEGLVSRVPSLGGSSGSQAGKTHGNKGVPWS